MLVDNQPVQPPPSVSEPLNDPGILILRPDQSTIPSTQPLSENSEQPMEVDSIVTAPALAPVQSQHQPSLSPQILKTIKKLDIELLCHPHNPVRSQVSRSYTPIFIEAQATLAAKKAQQQERIRSALYALPPMSRIKLRVTAGVFEVTLVRIIEETSSVEVLWDRGLKREFKWRSVVFGETDAVVGQKPTEAAPEPSRMSYLLVPMRCVADEPEIAASNVNTVPAVSSAATPAPAQAPPLAYAPSAAANTSRPAASEPHQPSNNQYQPAQSYHPRQSGYQYAPWSPHQYSAPSTSQPSCPSDPASQRPQGGRPSAQSYAQPAYSQPQYPYSYSNMAGYYPYASSSGSTSYSPYAQYSGYSYAPPPSTPSHQYEQPQVPKPLTWQEPYPGPRQIAQKLATPPAVSVPMQNGHNLVTQATTAAGSSSTGNTPLNTSQSPPSTLQPSAVLVTATGAPS